MPDEARRAVAVVVERGGLLLAVRRPDEPGEELPNIWGLPATTLVDGESDEEAVRRVGREKLGVELTIGRALGHGEQDRDTYTLRMAVYEATMSGTPVLPDRVAGTATLYHGIDWLPVESFREAADLGSLCCRVLLEVRT